MSTALDEPADEGVEVSDVVAATRSRSLAARTQTLSPRAAEAASEPIVTDAPRPRGLEASGSSRRGLTANDQARYELLGVLGRGAMGEVLLARDQDLLRKVALKRMAPAMLESRPLAERFFNEAQITAQLDHPHIVPVYGVEIAADGTPGYSMKLVQGWTLSEVLAEAAARLDGASGADVERGLAERLEFFLKICDAMAFAHGKGVLHRDLKPDNVMIGRYNEVYVMDWGICRLVGSQDESQGDAIVVDGDTQDPGARTHIGAVMGTPLYMSPEQANGQNATLDARSDLYTLGLILYEITALRRARPGETLAEVMVQAACGLTQPLPHRAGRFSVPRELRAIVAKATAAARDDRYASVTELADDLRRYLRGEAVRAAPDGPWQRAARWLARHRTRALGAMAALLLLAAGAVIVSLVHERVALARAAQYERTTQRFLSAVQQQAQVIDERFYRDERILGELASAAGEALAHADVAKAGRVYFSDDFAAASAAPADLAPSAFYRRSISLEWPVIKLAPGVAARSVDRDVRVLGLLGPALRAAVETGIGGSDRSAEALHARFMASGGEIARAFVSLETGVHTSYPGVAGFQAGYDPRTRPKYRLAAGQRGIRWGNAYRDPFGLGIMLPASIALYGDGGELVGVAGIVTTLEHVRETLLGLPVEPNVDEAMLVDVHGRVLATTIDGGRSASAEPAANDAESEPPVDLPPLRFPAVRAAIDASRSGFIEVDAAAGPRIVAFYRLSSLGWYYVVVADPERLVPAADTFSAVDRSPARG